MCSGGRQRSVENGTEPISPQTQILRRVTVITRLVFRVYLKLENACRSQGVRVGEVALCRAVLEEIST